MSQHALKGLRYLVGATLFCVAVGQSWAAEGLSRVVEREDVQMAEGVVEAINANNRIVTIRSLERDRVIVMEVGDEVRNLAQVEVGDRVMVEFLEALAVDLKKGGGLEPSTGLATTMGRAQPGERPAGAVGDALVLVATIVGIDRDKPSVSLKGPKGNVMDVVVRDPGKLEGVAVGDQVVITYTRALAIGVKPSPVQ